MQLYIVLGVLILMVIAMVSGKFPLGLVTISACVILIFTKVLTVSQAFAGFCNQNLILCGGFFVLAGAFGKTAFVKNIQKALMSLQGSKSGNMILIATMAVTFLLGNLISPAAVVMLIVVFLGSMPTQGEISSSRLLLPVAVVASIAMGKLPLNMTVVLLSYNNSFLKAAGSNLRITLPQLLEISAIPMIVVFLFIFFGYRLLPKYDISSMANDDKPESSEKPLEKWQEILTYVVFIATIIAMFLNSQIGDMMYAVPAVAAIILSFAKVMSNKEVRSILSMDIMFMLAGVFVMADVMTKSGAGKMIGKGILTALGGHPNQFLILLVFGMVTMILSNVMSKMGTMMLMVPIAIATAMAAGINPCGIALVTAEASSASLIIPTGSPALAVAFGYGKYKMSDTFKFTIPISILYILALCASVFLVFPA